MADDEYDGDFDELDMSADDSSNAKKAASKSNAKTESNPKAQSTKVPGAKAKDSFADVKTASFQSVVVPPNTATPHAATDVGPYALSVELKAVHEFQETRAIFFAYTYPTFGPEPIISPPVQVTAHTETPIIGASTVFALNLSMSQLSAVFVKDPLIFEVMGTDQTEVGLVKVSLTNLMSAPVVNGKKQLHALFPIFRLTSAQQVVQIGKLRLCMSIQSQPFAPASHQPAFASSQPAMASSMIAPPTSSGIPRPANLTPMEEEVRRRLEHQITWDLEMWRRAEEAKCMARWKQQEADRLNELETEWRRQEVQRDQVLAKKRKEVNALEKKLKQSLFELEKQEANLHIKEAELKQKQSYHQKVINELKDESEANIKRAKDNHKHQVTLREQKMMQMADRHATTTEQLKTTRKNLEVIEAEFAAYKLRMSKSSTGQLRIELQQKEAENAILTKKLEEAEERERFAKEQTRKALKELARMGKERNEEREKRLHAERLDLQRLRQEYLGKQRQTGSSRDGVALESIRRDLRSLMANGSQAMESSGFPSDTAPQFERPSFPFHNDSTQSHGSQASISTKTSGSSRPWKNHLEAAESRARQAPAANGHVNGNDNGNYRLSELRGALLSPDGGFNRGQSRLGYASAPATSDGSVAATGAVDDWEVRSDVSEDPAGNKFRTDDGSERSFSDRSDPSGLMHARELNMAPSDRLHQLLEERNDLLSTGVYQSNHPIIASLDNHIRSLQAATQ